MQTYADGLFYRRPVHDFPQRDRQVIEIDCETTISDAFGVLLTHNIPCAPVWDAQQQGYLGFFDIDDALNIAYDIDLITDSAGSAAAPRLKTSAVKVLDIFVKANMIRNPEMQAPWIAVGPNVVMKVGFPCQAAFLTLSKDIIPILARQARRVPVVDPQSGKCVKLLSQMDICRALHTAVVVNGPPPPFLLQTPAQCGLGLKDVIKVTEDDEARDAFRTMIDHAVSAVAVVDETGRLAGCIANKDIQMVGLMGGGGLTWKQVTRGAATAAKKPQKLVAPMMAAPSRHRGRFSIAGGTMGNANFLGMPALMFVGEVRKQLEADGKTHAAVTVAHPDTPLVAIIEKMATTHHHRVFLVDQDHRPVGVVSVKDVCRLLEENLEEKRAPPPVPTRG